MNKTIVVRTVTRVPHAKFGKIDYALGSNSMYLRPKDMDNIPIKTMAFEESVNVTIGLPYLRVSVDHGTAFDIVGTGKADARSMRAALDLAVRLAVRR